MQHQRSNQRPPPYTIDEMIQLQQRAGNRPSSDNIQNFPRQSIPGQHPAIFEELMQQRRPPSYNIQESVHQPQRQHTQPYNDAAAVQHRSSQRPTSDDHKAPGHHRPGPNHPPPSYDSLEFSQHSRPSPRPSLDSNQVPMHRDARPTPRQPPDNHQESSRHHRSSNRPSFDPPPPDTSVYSIPVQYRIDRYYASGQQERHTVIYQQPTATRPVPVHLFHHQQQQRQQQQSTNVRVNITSHREKVVVVFHGEASSGSSLSCIKGFSFEDTCLNSSTEQDQ